MEIWVFKKEKKFLALTIAWGFQNGLTCPIKLSKSDFISYDLRYGIFCNFSKKELRYDVGASLTSIMI